MSDRLDYRGAGVDLEGADKHVDAISEVVTSTWGDGVIGGFGGFAAGIEVPEGMRRPVMMLSTDGVGTKLELARRLDLWEGVGFDLVAMCADDLTAAGATTVGFVDYMAVGTLHPERDRAVVASVAEACRRYGCPLLGGETAEHPGVMAPDAIDLAGAALGVVEHGEEIAGEGVRVGDVIIGLHSPNLRSNGFSLVRKIVAEVELEDSFPGESRSIGEVLLEPSVLYGPLLGPVLGDTALHGMAHITGGGIPGNLARILGSEHHAVVERDRWEEPEVFGWLRDSAGLDDAAMVETFNLGIGFCVVVAPDVVDGILEAIAGSAVIGHVVDGERGVTIK